MPCLPPVSREQHEHEEQRTGHFSTAKTGHFTFGLTHQNIHLTNPLILWYNPTSGKIYMVYEAEPTRISSCCTDPHDTKWFAGDTAICIRTHISDVL